MDPTQDYAPDKFLQNHYWNKYGGRWCGWHQYELKPKSALAAYAVGMCLEVGDVHSYVLTMGEVNMADRWVRDLMEFGHYEVRRV
jgi:hypothetical protein